MSRFVVALRRARLGRSLALPGLALPGLALPVALAIMISLCPRMAAGQASVFDIQSKPFVVGIIPVVGRGGVVGGVAIDAQGVVSRTGADEAGRLREARLKALADVGGGSKVQVLDGLTTGLIVDFTAFTPGDTSSYNAPLDVAALDEDGDGIAELILAAQGSDGKANEVRRFDALTGALVGALPESSFDSSYQGIPINDFLGAYFVAPLEDSSPPVMSFDVVSTGQVNTFVAYGPTYFGEVHIARGDLNGDGVEEIVTSPGRNYKPLVRVFDQAGNLLTEFLAYASSFKGGVHVAVGDVNGDGKNDIATSMVSGGSRVRVSKNTSAAGLPDSSLTFSTFSSFYPFGSRFKGGAMVELADLGKPITVSGARRLHSGQLDGKAEVIVANQAGMRPTVKAFSYFGASTKATAVRTYLPFESGFRGGLSLDLARIDGDLVPDIIVGAGPGGASRIQVLSGATAGNIVSFSAFAAGESPSYNAKLTVQAEDANNDGLAEYLLAARAFDGSSREIRRLDALTGEQVDSYFENYPHAKPSP